MTAIASRALLLGAVFAAVAVASPVTAETPEVGRITGTVYDAISDETLVGASVRVLGTSLGDATDLDGRFSIVGVPSGEQRLVVSYVGYETDTLAVMVPEGGRAVEVDIALSNATFDEIVVTAQVAGQLAAINEQYQSRTVVNVVSADRIQELPDNNAAESVGRIPGVSIQRSGGEANKVAIRGLSPKFNNVTVNGVRLAGTDGGDRSVDLSLVSSNIIDGIEVRKAITPDMDADAVGGTINLRLRSAPNDPTLDILAQGGYTGLQDYTGNYKIVGSTSNRFFGDRLGAFVTFNAEEYDRSADKLNVSYGRTSFPDSTDANGDPVPALRVDNLTTREETILRSRLGGSLLLDYRLQNGRITANAFLNERSDDALYRFRTAAERIAYNIQEQDNTTRLLTSAVGVEQEFGWIRYDAAATYSRSRASSPENFTWVFSRDVTAFQQDPDSRIGILPQDVLVRVDSLTELSQLWVDDSRLDEDQVGFQLNLQAPFRIGGWASGFVKTGGKARWLTREFDTNRFGRQGLQYPDADLYECLAQGVPDFADQFRNGDRLPISTILGEYDREDEFLDGVYGLGLIADRDRLMAITRALQSTEFCSDPRDTPGADVYYGEYIPESISSLGSDYDGAENYQAAYVMAELNLGSYVTLIPGIRYERDDTEYTGQVFRAIAMGQVGQPPQDFERITRERTFSYWLPMVHLDVRPTDWVSVRLARTETLARPNYNQYAPITSIDIYNSTVVAANSLLRPSPATNYDASVQVIREGLGLVGVSVFYKEIEDLVVNVAIPITASLPPPEGTNVPETWYESARPTLYTAVNSEEPTTFYGYELEWQTNFSYLPGLLKGLVLNLNYTRSFSEATYQSFLLSSTTSCNPRPCTQVFSISDTTRTGRMPDQAAHIANVTIGYDFKGFSARVSYLFQSNTTSYVDPRQPLLDTFVGDYSRFDLSVRQKLALGLEVFANANNLNNRPDQAYTNQNSVTGDYSFSDRGLSYRELYGYTVDVGARYRF